LLFAIDKNSCGDIFDETPAEILNGAKKDHEP